MKGQFEVGTEVYFTGDMANEPSSGKILKVYQPDQFSPLCYDIQLDDGRLSRKIWHLAFQPSPGRRFMLMTERKQQQLAALENLQKTLLKVKKGNQQNAQ